MESMDGEFSRNAGPYLEQVQSTRFVAVPECQFSPYPAG